MSAVLRLLYSDWVRCRNELLGLYSQFVFSGGYITEIEPAVLSGISRLQQRSVLSQHHSDHWNGAALAIYYLAIDVMDALGRNVDAIIRGSPG